MVRCLNCKKYIELWDGKPPNSINRLDNDTYSDPEIYEYLIVIPYQPITGWQWIANIFRRKKWIVIGGIAVWANDYKTAYKNSTLEVVWLQESGHELRYAGMGFISHSRDFDKNAGYFKNIVAGYPKGQLPEGAMLKCMSCGKVSDIQEAVKFWEMDENYYSDLPLCACGGEILNDFEAVPESKIMRTVFRCENCETVYDREQYGDKAVDLSDV